MSESVRYIDDTTAPDCKRCDRSALYPETLHLDAAKRLLQSLQDTSKVDDFEERFPARGDVSLQ